MEKDSCMLSPDFFRTLPCVDRVETDQIRYFGNARIEMQREEPLEREKEMSSDQQRQREQSPEPTSAPSFGPQVDQEMERDVDLPVARKRSLESMQKTLVATGLHPVISGVPRCVLEATNFSLNASGGAELPFGRGGILLEPPMFPWETSPGWTGWGNSTWRDHKPSTGYEPNL